MILISHSTYCEDLVFTFNHVNRGQTFERVCWIKNKTDSKVLFVDINTSCDCIKYACKEKSIPAKDSVAITIKYTAKDPGLFCKTINVITTDKKCNCKIILKGKVEN